MLKTYKTYINKIKYLKKLTRSLAVRGGRTSSDVRVSVILNEEALCRRGARDKLEIQNSQRDVHDT